MGIIIQVPQLTIRTTIEKDHPKHVKCCFSDVPVWVVVWSGKPLSWRIFKELRTKINSSHVLKRFRECFKSFSVPNGHRWKQTKRWDHCLAWPWHRPKALHIVAKLSQMFGNFCYSGIFTNFFVKWLINIPKTKTQFASKFRWHQFHKIKARLLIFVTECIRNIKCAKWGINM